MAKARQFRALYAALKGRSSTVALNAFSQQRFHGGG